MKNDNYETIVDAFVNLPLIPTLLPISSDALLPMIRVMSEEGLNVLEILCRPVDVALEVFEELNRHHELKMIHLGLGTVNSRDTAVKCVKAGADFLVSPAFSRDVLDVAAESGIPYIPRVFTFQDVQNVIDAFAQVGRDVRILKLCPSSEANRRYVEMLAGCYPGIRYTPSGDKDMDAIVAWKSSPHIGATFSGQFLPIPLVETRDVNAMRARLLEIRGILQKTTQLPPSA